MDNVVSVEKLYKLVEETLKYRIREYEVNDSYKWFIYEIKDMVELLDALDNEERIWIIINTTKSLQYDFHFRIEYLDKDCKKGRIGPLINIGFGSDIANGFAFDIDKILKVVY